MRERETSEVRLMKLFTLLCVLALTGCSTLAPGVQRASEAYDDSLVAAEVWLCRGASIGSVVRAYGRDEAAWEAWKTLCGYGGTDVNRPEPTNAVD